MSALRSVAVFAVGLTLTCRPNHPAADPAARDSSRAAIAPATISPTPDTGQSAPCPPQPAQGAANPYTEWNLPAWAAARLQKEGYLGRLEIFTELNPFYVTGLFDDDTLTDLALQVRDRASRQRGVLILHRGTAQSHLLGAGHAVGNGGEDWSWLWEWYVADPGEFEATGFRGHQALLVSKPESASGYLWWDGNTYQWTQGAD